ncbi:hypothetical protein KZ390_01700 [Glaesserella parasuis]|nr:hypothetical protein [Glaesserella parasuis]
MKNPKQYAQRYVNWVLRLGKGKSALLGLIILAVFAIFTQSLLSWIFTGSINTSDIFRSIIFGLTSAPFVIYLS